MARHASAGGLCTPRGVTLCTSRRAKGKWGQSDPDRMKSRSLNHWAAAPAPSTCSS